MKDFVIVDFERFLEIADSISTPFKFYEVGQSDVGSDCKLLEAKVWMRTAYLSFERDVAVKEFDEFVKMLERHGFTKAEVRETAYPIK